MSDVRILIRPSPNENARRITKIVPYPTGGFAVLVPYHSARRGWLAKVPVDYKKVGAHTVPWTECVEYEASDRVKLSYHADGFVQFSGENPIKIRSGRDTDGQPKGLGLVTRPPSNPITSGPTFSIVCWGLSEFREDQSPSSTDIVFDESDLYHRNCTPDTYNGYVIWGFVFQESMWTVARKRPGAGYSLFTARPELAGGIIEWRIMQLPGQPIFIGLSANRTRVGFPEPSGFNMNSPGTRGDDDRGHVLMATYPGPLGRAAKGLDLDP
jgi:hypothetical protein